MPTIKLTQEKITNVDDQDYKYLNQFKWCYMNGYAVRGIRNGKQTTLIFMHDVIMGVRGIDHIDRDKLNNSRSNLRIATKSQNAVNTRIDAHKTAKSKSKYKGVTWSVAAKKWQAKIGFQGTYVNLGLFVNEHEAAKAYNSEALALFGEFATLNEIG